MALSTYELPVIHFYMKLKIGIKYIIGSTPGQLKLINIVRMSEVLWLILFFTTAAPL